MAASQKECRELICWAALLGQPLVLCPPSPALIRGRNKLTHKRSKFPRKLDKKGQIFSVTFYQCQFSSIICSLAVFSSIGCWRLSKKNKHIVRIHAKNVWCGGEGYFGQKKFAEKVRKSRQNINRNKSAWIVKIDKNGENRQKMVKIDKKWCYFHLKWCYLHLRWCYLRRWLGCSIDFAFSA